MPVLLGVYLIWFFYSKLTDADKDTLFSAFKKADYVWVIFGLVPGFLSHLSRAWRWRYMLAALGHKVPFWNSYHAVMIGYIVNYALPRAGEASRAGLVYRYNKVPFNKGFGTIVAERIIDLCMLGGITLITLAMQSDQIDLFRSRVELFQHEMGSGGSGGIDPGTIIMYALAAALFGVVLLAIIKSSFRKKVIGFFIGLLDGLKTVFSMNQKWAYLGHTVFIWVMYVLMFAIPFQSLEATADVPVEGILTAFIAGTVGIVLVQGGIGVYPAFVGMIVTIYMASGSQNLIEGNALAMGWIIWTSQTLMMILLGGISLFLMPRINRISADAAH